MIRFFAQNFGNAPVHPRRLSQPRAQGRRKHRMLGYLAVVARLAALMALAMPAGTGFADNADNPDDADDVDNADNANNADMDATIELADEPIADIAAADATVDAAEIIELSMEDLRDDSLKDLLGLSISVASRSTEELSAAPSSVTVFTKEEIKALGITSLEELINHAPGFQATRDVERGTAMRISARGRSTALSEYILVLIDGQPLNDPYSGGVTLINRHISLDHVKQVEIIRGPGSALYGSNAFLGVINIVSDFEENSLTLRAGSMGLRQAAVSMAYGDEERGWRVSGFVAAFAEDGQEYTDLTDIRGITNNTHDPRDGMDIQGALSYGGVSLHLRHMERHFQEFIPIGVLQRFTGSEDASQSSIRLALSHKLAPWLELSAAGYYARERLASRFSFYGSPATPVMPVDAADVGPLVETSTFAAEAGAVVRPFANNQLQVGVNYTLAPTPRVGVLGNFNPNTLMPTDSGLIEEITDGFTLEEGETRHIGGVYVQDKQTLFRGLSITAGARIDLYSDFGSSLNPRAAIVYQTPLDSVLKLIYGRAFRAPNFLELYDVGPTLFGNPDVEPESIDTAEVSYSQNLSQLNITATFFYNSVTDEILIGDPVIRDDFPAPIPIPNPINDSGRSNSQGIEVEFAAYPIPGLKLRGTYTHLFQDADTASVASDFASLMASYRFWDLTVGASAVFRDDVPLLPDQDAYLLVDANAIYQLSERLRLTASAKNLLDTEYMTPTSVFEDGVVNRGRQVGVGVVAEY